LSDELKSSAKKLSPVVASVRASVSDVSGILAAGLPRSEPPSFSLGSGHVTCREKSVASPATASFFVPLSFDHAAALSATDAVSDATKVLATGVPPFELTSCGVSLRSGQVTCLGKSLADPLANASFSHVSGALAVALPASDTPNVSLGFGQVAC
jgi:hypothetical protein